MQERDIIRIRGARENNLKDVSLDIPKYKIPVFTGVSGSGKSSLVEHLLFKQGVAGSNPIIYTAGNQAFMET